MPHPQWRVLHQSSVCGIWRPHQKFSLGILVKLHFLLIFKRIKNIVFWGGILLSHIYHPQRHKEFHSTPRIEQPRRWTFLTSDLSPFLTGQEVIDSFIKTKVNDPRTCFCSFFFFQTQPHYWLWVASSTRHGKCSVPSRGKPWSPAAQPQMGGWTRKPTLTSGPSCFL